MRRASSASLVHRAAQPVGTAIVVVVVIVGSVRRRCDAGPFRSSTGSEATSRPTSSRKSSWPPACSGRDGRDEGCYIRVLWEGIEAMSDHTSLAVAYRLNAVNFRMSAERLMEGLDTDDLGRPTKLTAVPLYFLASHAAELFLKAALLKRGFDKAALKKFDYRHNLAALLE